MHEAPGSREEEALKMSIINTDFTQHLGRDGDGAVWCEAGRGGTGQA